MPNMNITVSKPVHIALYIVACLLTALSHLVSHGDVKVSGSVAALMATVLTVVNSVDPAATLAKATPAQLEVAAKRLPYEVLGRLADSARLQSVK
jgi:hypothetical protein